MDWKLELVVVPVADVDRAKHFYSEQVGFVVRNRAKQSTRLHNSAKPNIIAPALRQVWDVAVGRVANLLSDPRTSLVLEDVAD